MPEFNYWDYVLSPGFLIPFALVLGGFVPLLYSIYVTWQENKHKERKLNAEVRAERAERAARRQRQ